MNQIKLTTSEGIKILSILKKQKKFFDVCEIETSHHNIYISGCNHQYYITQYNAVYFQYINLLTNLKKLVDC